MLAAPTPVVEQTYTGTRQSDLGAGNVPNTMGAVGPSHVVELLNSSYAVYDKSNGQLISRVSQDSFWNTALAATGAGTTANAAASRVIYDSASGHWFASAVDRKTSVGRQILLAVSNCEDPTAGWKAFKIDPDTTNFYVPDIPALGVDADGVYITALMQDYLPDNFTPDPQSGVTIISIPKLDLIGASPTVANATIFQNVDPNIQSNPFVMMQPVLDFGASDGRQSLIYASASTLLRTDVLNAAGPGAATLTSRQSLPTDAGDTDPPDAPQPGTISVIDTNTSFLRSAVYESNNTYWMAYTVAAGGRSAIRWKQIDADTNTILQSGLISDPNLWLYYPSIAVNTDGDVVIGFSGSSSTQPVSSYFVAGATSIGSTQFSPVTLLRAGTGFYQAFSSIYVNWGEYSATVVDPVNPDRFWTFQEYVDSNQVWGISISSILVDAGQDPPVILTSSGTTAYTEGAPATVVDPMATVTDTDSPDLDGGTLTVSLHVNGSSADRLAIRNQGTGAGQIGVSGSDLTYGGTIIGTFTGGVGTTPLVVTFNSSATPVAADTLVRNITFANVSSTPLTATRTVRFIVTDGDGGTSGARHKLVSVAAINNEPVVTTSAGTTAYSENAAAMVIDGSMTVTDADSANFASGTFTIDFAASGVAEDSLAIRFQGTGAGQINTSGSNVRYGSITIGTFSGGLSGSPLVIALNSSATPAAVQALARNITYFNSSDTPYTANRSVRFVLTDESGATSLPAFKTVSVSSINDIPVITIPAGTTAYTENGAPVAVTSTATLSDVDSADFNGGMLTVDYSSGGSVDDRLSVFNQGTGAGQIGVMEDNTGVTYGGTMIGRYAGGIGTSALIVTLLDTATPAAVQALIRSITFANVSDNPSGSNRTVRFVLTDGDGGTSAFKTRTVSVTTVNDATVVTTSAGTTAYTEGAAPVDIDSAATVTDLDNYSFFNGSLTIDFQTNGTVDDRLAIRNQGTGSGQIGISGSNVQYAGITFATFSGGTGTSPLVISFNVNATVTTALMQTLVRNITFANVSSIPSTADRTVRFSLVEGSGLASVPVTKVVSVTAVLPEVPLITLPSGTPTYVENAAPLLVASTATVVDPDTADYGGGTLTADFSANGSVDDRLSINNQGTGAGQIGISAVSLSVTFGGTVVGTYTGGTGTTPLVVTFNSYATPAAAQALIRNITFANVSDDPSVLTRTVRFVITDGDGGTSIAKSRQLFVSPTTDNPVVLTSPGATSYVENSAPVLIDPAGTVIDVDTPIFFSNGQMTIDFKLIGDFAAGDAASGDKLAIRNEGSGAGQIGVSGNTVTFGGTSIGTFAYTNGAAPLVITFSGGNVTPAVTQALMRNITYANTSDNPDTTDRTVWFKVYDGQGGIGSGMKLVSVTAVDDAGLITPSAGAVQTYVENDPPVVVDPLITVTDPDGGPFSIASLTIDYQIMQITGTPEDRLAIRNVGTGAGEIGVSGDTITFGGIEIGTFVGGDGTTPLVVTFGANATLPATEALLRNVTYSNVGDDPALQQPLRVVRFRFTDSYGQPGVAATKSVNISAVDDNPVITTSAGASQFIPNGAAIIIDSQSTVTDIDYTPLMNWNLIVDFSANGTADDRLAIRNQGTGIAQIGLSGQNITYEGLTIGRFQGGTGTTPLSILFNDLANISALRELVRSITFANVNANPSMLDRTVRFDLSNAFGGSITTATKVVAMQSPNTVPVVGSISGPSSAVRGQTVSINVPFTDAGVVESHVAVIDWGDGTLRGGIVLEAGGAGTVSGAHEYATAGTFPITVRVIDSLNQSSSSTYNISIAAVQLVPNPQNASKMDLFVGGTSAADTITLSSSAGKIGVVINGTNLGLLSATGRILVFGHDGNDTVTLSSAITLPAVLDGGSGNDTLTGGAGPDILQGGLGDDTVNGGSGNDTLIADAGNDLMIGGAGNDTHVFDADLLLGSDTVNESGGGIDTLDFSATNANLVVIINSTVPHEVTPNLTLTLTSATTIDSVIGGSGSDVIVGNDLANTFTGGAGFDSISGLAGNDLYLYDTDTQLDSDTIVDSAGVDTIDFSATTSLGIALNLGLIDPQAVNSNLRLELRPLATIENVIGGALADTITGNALSNVLTGNGGNDILIGLAGNNTLNGGDGNDTLTGDVGSDIMIGGAGDDTLNGAAGNDTYQFDADTPLGSDSIVDTAGTDLLDFAATGSLGVSVSLGLAIPQVVNANLTLTLNSNIAIENAYGGSKNDTLSGNSAINRFIGNGGDDLLAGGPGNDIYVFDADVSLGTDRIVEDQNAGLDLLDFSPTTTLGVSVNLTGTGTQVVNNNLSLVITSNDILEYLTGGSQADTLIGNSAPNRITGGPGDDTMDGGAGDDVYIFDADVALGSDTVIENSSKGIDLLDFSLTTTRNIVLSLSVSGPQVVNDRLTLTIGGNQEFENITGGSLHDHLTGNSLVNVLTGGAGDDNLEGLESGDSLIGGAGNDTLAGGGGDDKYLFDADSALGSDVLVEQATALGGVDLLDFSATTGVGITLDLASTGPQVLNARHTLTLSSGAAFEIVLGTALADTIHGNSLNNALFGGRGNDTLRGFGGRDLIVAGSGIDSLYGGDDEDLLIAGLLSYYNESTGALDRTALDWIMAEWTRLDADYQLRMSHLRVGGGLNGIARLTASTVPSETTYIDTLFGEAGLDWFWGYNKDVFADLGTGGPEVVN